ncbi:MAG: hypothetical protein M1832_000059 [Thelocarpon impressellum]|nr:MAG: hypothetical protein M1832_000059 [Thelocarpon impressellum]
MPPDNVRPLSHAEIWDDSALIQSWAEALEEYRFYHSIKARGEKVGDVLAAADAKGTDRVSEAGQDGPNQNESVYAGSVEENDGAEVEELGPEAGKEGARLKPNLRQQVHKDAPPSTTEPVLQQAAASAAKSGRGTADRPDLPNELFGGAGKAAGAPVNLHVLADPWKQCDTTR